MDALTWLAAAPPSVVESTYDIRHVNLLDPSEAPGRQYQRFTAAVLRVYFDQARFTQQRVNGLCAGCARPHSRMNRSRYTWTANRSLHSLTQTPSVACLMVRSAAPKPRRGTALSCCCHPCGDAETGLAELQCVGSARPFASYSNASKPPDVWERHNWPTYPTLDTPAPATQGPRVPTWLLALPRRHNAATRWLRIIECVPRGSGLLSVAPSCILLLSATRRHDLLHEPVPHNVLTHALVLEYDVDGNPVSNLRCVHCGCTPRPASCRCTVRSCCPGACSACLAPTSSHQERMASPILQDRCAWPLT